MEKYVWKTVSLFYKSVSLCSFCQYSVFLVRVRIIICNMTSTKPTHLPDCIPQNPERVNSCQFTYSSLSGKKKRRKKAELQTIAFLAIWSHSFSPKCFIFIVASWVAWDLAGEWLWWLISAPDYSQSALLYLYSHHITLWQAFSLQISSLLLGFYWENTGLDLYNLLFLSPLCGGWLLSSWLFSVWCWRPTPSANLNSEQCIILFLAEGRCMKSCGLSLTSCTELVFKNRLIYD